MDKNEKRELVSSLNTAFKNAASVVIAHNTGLTVAEISDLRRQLRSVGANYKVAKNRLVSLALEETQFDILRPMLEGPTTFAWSADPVGVAKVLVSFAKTNEKLKIVGGALGPQLLDGNGVKSLAELPSLDELRAKLIGLLTTPATRIAAVTQAPAAQVARVLSAYSESEQAA